MSQSTAALPVFTVEDLDALLDLVADNLASPVGPFGCWLAGESTQYPLIRVAGRVIRLHRFVYLLTKGPIPRGFVVDHECHNRDLTCPGGLPCWHRRCIRPDHLFARTRAENSARARRGERNRVAR